MTEMDLFGGAVQRTASDGLTRQDGGSDEWLTPPDVLAALGPFDLDPCSPGQRRPWDTAAIHYDAAQDGMRLPWSGRVWLNPPYSDATRWIARLAEHGHGTALIFARTETRMWHEHIWPKASGLLFLRGRLRFCYVNGKAAGAAAAPSVLVAYGPADAALLATEPLDGKFVRLEKAARPLRHRCSVPRCDGTRLGHDLAAEFPEATRRIDEAFDRLAGSREDYVMPENLRVDDEESA